MKYLAAYTLLVLAGNKNPSILEINIKLLQMLTTLPTFSRKSELMSMVLPSIVLLKLFKEKISNKSLPRDQRRSKTFLSEVDLLPPRPLPLLLKPLLPKPQRLKKRRRILNPKKMSIWVDFSISDLKTITIYKVQLFQQFKKFLHKLPSFLNKF